jgi:hypothetical protein
MVFSKFRRNPTAHARLKEDDDKGDSFFFSERKFEDKRPMLNTSSDENEERDERWIAAFKKSEHARTIPVEPMKIETNIVEPKEDITQEAFSAEEIMTAALQLKSPKAEESVTPRAGTPSYLPASITPSLVTKTEKPIPAVRETSSSTFASESTMQTSNTLDQKDAMIASLKNKCAKLHDKILQYGDVDRYIEPNELSKLEQEKYDLKKQLKVTNSELKFTQNALEDATAKMQTHSQEKIQLKEIIKHQKGQIDGLETKQLKLESDNLELTQKLEKEKAELANKIESREDQLHDMKLKCELLEKELRDVRWQLDKANSVVIEHNMTKAPPEQKNASDSEESVFDGVDDSHSTTPNTFDDSGSLSSSYHNPFNDVHSTHTKSSKPNEKEQPTNPFENDDAKPIKKQTSNNPFDDAGEGSENALGQSINPFDNDQDVMNPDDGHVENPSDRDAERLAEQKAIMRKQLDEMQAKYAQKMADQLSKIAALQEENDIKDIQLQQLKESLEKEALKKNNRRAFNWRRKDSNYSGDSGDELEKTWHPHS